MRQHPLPLTITGHIITKPLDCSLFLVCGQVLKHGILHLRRGLRERVLSCTGEPRMELVVHHRRIELVPVLRLLARDACGPNISDHITYDTHQGFQVYR